MRFLDSKNGYFDHKPKFLRHMVKIRQRLPMLKFQRFKHIEVATFPKYLFFGIIELYGASVEIAV